MIQLNSYHAVVLNINYARVIKRTLHSRIIMSNIEALYVPLLDTIKYAIYKESMPLCIHPARQHV